MLRYAASIWEFLICSFQIIELSLHRSQFSSAPQFSVEPVNNFKSMMVGCICPNLGD